jgi:hypothetical protein
VSAPGWIVTRNAPPRLDLRMDPALPLAAKPAPIVLTVRPKPGTTLVYFDAQGDLDPAMGNDPSNSNNVVYKLIDVTPAVKR